MIRRDLIEEKESLIRTSLRKKLQPLLSTQDQVELKFTFSVLVDDGNLMTALVAASNDLLVQVPGLVSPNSLLWTCLLCCTDLTKEGQTLKQWIIDPNLEETVTLSENLLLVTFLKTGDTE